MERRKIKILMLGTMDFDLAGHVYFAYKNLPPSFDKRIVVKYTVNGNKDIALYDSNSSRFKWRRRFDKYIYIPLMRFLKYGIVNFKIDPDKEEYCFKDYEFGFVSAKQILAKHKGFIPDVISIYWVSNFITSKTIRDLYELTHAKIVVVFVDQAHMTGGCHYPVECLGYQQECDNCLALSKGKSLVKKQLRERVENLKDIPITICGAPDDCLLATEKSTLFKGKKYIGSVSYPKVTKTPQSVARQKIGIEHDKFVILIGASKITEKRKGAIYALEALKVFGEKYKNVCVLAVGRIEDSEIETLKQIGMKLILPGYVSMEELFLYYCASDCFLSTTIADSGPMMVNFSMALGIPVVSFKVGIAATLIQHKKTGYIAQLRNIDELVEGLEYIKNLSTTDRETMVAECLKLMDFYKSQNGIYKTIYNNYIDGTL